MSKLKITDIQSNLFEELDDADLVAVTGGSLLSNVGDTLTKPGNQNQPTSSAVRLGGNTVSDVGDFISGPVTGFTEGTLQGTNKIVTDVTG